MKLLHCTECKDVVALHRKMRTCLCGKSKGYYLDTKRVTFSGPGIIIGFNNDQFLRATELSQTIMGYDFAAFTISNLSPSVVRSEDTL